MSTWLEITLAILGGLITIFTLWNLVEQRIKTTRMPTTNLEERVSLIEKKLEFEIKASFAEYDARFGRDKQRLDSIEEGNKVTQKALLALLSHAIDGNNVDEMKEAKISLQKYLIER